MFIGYCYKFHLYARHSITINGKPGDIHPHTWNLVAYVEPNGDFFEFNETEEIIKQVLKPYQYRNLNEKEPFDQLNPTLENMGEVFFVQFMQALQEYKINIKKLEISESPVRVYVVDQNTVSSGKNSKNLQMPLSGFLQGVIHYTTETVSGAVLAQDKEKTEFDRHPERRKDEWDTGNGCKVLQQEKKEITPSEITTPQEKASLQWVHIILSILTIIGSAALLLYYVNLRGHYPWGSDTYGHIFKADLLYKNMKMGNYFPRYTELWYNGIQPFRYWAPIPYYILAIFQFFTKGDGIAAYNIFIAFCFVFGAFGWLLWGIRERRLFLSLILGMLWFCMPDNIRVFFSEGNIPRVLIAVLLPYFFFFLWNFIEHRKRSALIGIILLMTLTCLSHLMIAAMVGMTAFLFLLYYGIANRAFGRPLQALVGMLLAISLCGIWLYPALQGGLMSMDSEAVSEVMKDLTFPFTQTLNPLLRFGNIEIYYFGLSFVLISVAGLFLSNKKSIPGFLTLITIFLGTTTAFVPILLKLPFNQLLWMMRFTPVAYAMFVIGILMWKSLRRYVTIILVLFVIIDSGLSFRLLAFNSNPSPDIQNMLDQAIEIADQRIAILDCSEFGSFPSYYLSSGEKPIPYAYGWAWQGAQTARNIVLLNTALEKEYYIFMFDRCLEAGCDTVIVKKDKVQDLAKLNAAAQRNRYSLIQEFKNAYLYKSPTPKSFGLETKYEGLAIGTSASNIVVEFSGFEIGNDNYLDAYTLEDLLQYRVIYLSGFEYQDQKKAEKLVLDAAERGVKVVVDMNRVPNEAITNRMTFLGVTAQPIQFEKKLPDLHFRGVTYFPITFQKENRKWNTVYLENVSNPRGFSWFGGNKLVFIGEHENANITFVGFNLLYHGIANEDSQVIDMFGTVIGMLKESLPNRKIVPIEIEYQKNQISITTDGENINTTLANLDAFEANSDIYSKHNFLHVTQPKTQIQIQYPYWKEGLTVSVAGLMATILFLYFVFRSKGEENEKSSTSHTSNQHSVDRVSV